LGEMRKAQGWRFALSGFREKARSSRFRDLTIRLAGRLIGQGPRMNVSPSW
jgi:hypothetical protein